MSFVVSRPEVFHEGVFISHSIRPDESIQNPRVDTNFREKSNAKFILVDNLRLGNLVAFTLKWADNISNVHFTEVYTVVR